MIGDALPSPTAVHPCLLGLVFRAGISAKCPSAKLNSRFSFFKMLLIRYFTRARVWSRYGAGSESAETGEDLRTGSEEGRRSGRRRRRWTNAGSVNAGGRSLPDAGGSCRHRSRSPSGPRRHRFPIPLFLVILQMTAVDVSVIAVTEAYNEKGGGCPVPPYGLLGRFFEKMTFAGRAGRGPGWCCC